MSLPRSGKPARQRPSLTFRPRADQEDITRWIEDHKARGDLPAATAMAIRLHMFMERQQGGKGEESYKPISGQFFAGFEPLIPHLASAVAEELLRRMPQLPVATHTVQEPVTTPVPPNTNNERSAVLQERFLASSGLLDDEDE